jgi:glycerophosphoryl diester phosphodiesterase
MNIFYACFLLLIINSFESISQVAPLERAHAHNDYEHNRPLFEALEHGFTSIEADIHLIDGELYVAHDHPENLDNTRTLKALYLDPLRQLIDKNKGKVHPGYDKPVYLLVDIKTDANSTLRELQNQVRDYMGILAHPKNPDGAVKIVISGNRDISQLVKDKEGIITIDGRPSDLEKNFSFEKMPMISENYNKVISWNGQGEISGKDFNTLADLARQVHRQGKLLRLWATPENEKVWEILLKAGVDLLNTDDLARLQNFLQENYTNTKN